MTAAADKPYTYEPLLPNQHTTRLFTLLPAPAPDCPLHGQIARAHHSHTPYTALSYVWGNTITLADTIRTPSGTLGITASLSAFLRAIRSPTAPLTLWVDALCINQADVRETNQQVAQMRSVFGAAPRALGWLGSTDEPTKGAVRALLDMLRRRREAGEGNGWREYLLGLVGEEEGRSTLRRVCAFFGRGFWTRLWIVQEVVVSERMELCYGRAADERFGARELLDVWGVRTDVAAAGREAGVDSGWEMPLDRLHNAGHVMGVVGFYPLEPLELLPCLQIFHNNSFTASRPHDFVYSVLGLFGTPPLRVEYEKPFREVYLEVLELVQHQTGKLDFLSSAWPTRLGTASAPVEPESHHGLPSWSVDWSEHHNERGVLQLATASPSIRQRLRAPTVYAAPGDTAQQLIFNRHDRTIQVSGIVVSTIQHKGSVFDRFSDDSLWPPDWAAVAGLRDLEPFRPTSDPDIHGGAFDTLHLGGELVDTKCLEEWWEALTANLPNQGDRLERWNVTGLVVPPKNRDDLQNLVTFLSSPNIWMAHHGRRLCRTSNSTLGLVPARAREGDVICAFHGGDVLYVLREIEDRAGVYEYIGESYLNGLMKGEALQTGQMPRNFCIR